MTNELFYWQLLAVSMIFGQALSQLVNYWRQWNESTEYRMKLRDSREGSIHSRFGYVWCKLSIIVIECVFELFWHILCIYATVKLLILYGYL